MTLKYGNVFKKNSFFRIWFFLKKNHIDIIFYRNEEQIYFIEHGTENPCHTFRVDDVTFYIIIK